METVVHTLFFGAFKASAELRRLIEEKRKNGTPPKILPLKQAFVRIPRKDRRGSQRVS